MVGKSPRKRDYSSGTTNMDGPVDIESTGGSGKRIKLTTTQENISMSPESEKENEHEFMLDSGSDCVPMENSINMDDEDEEEQYIDVVSEDSAIQEEELLEDDYGVEDPSVYQPIPHIAHMDNLISSHDDSAIIKSEIFDPAYDEMHQMLVSSGGDYDHSFFNGVEPSLLDLRPGESELNFPTPTSTNTSIDAKDNDSDLTINKDNLDQLYKDINCVSTSSVSLPSVTAISADANNGGSIQATLVSAPGLLPTVPNPVVNINNLNAASMLGGNAPVLTTPVFLAQGTPGPAGQTNSIITTHLARLVPSPDGKGYILHLGLTPQATASSGSVVSANNSCTSNCGLTVSSSISSISNSITSSSSTLSPSISAIPDDATAIQETIDISDVANSTAGGVVIGNHSPSSCSSIQSLPPQTSLNITLGSPTSEGSNHVSPNAMSSHSSDNDNSSSSHTGSDITTVTNGVTPVTSNINLNNLEGSVVTVSQKSPTGKPEISICSNITAAITTTANVNKIGGDVIDHVGNLVNGNATPAELTAAHLSLLDNTQQLLDRQQTVQLLQQQQQNPTRSKSKRRNSKELRELMELEQISSKPGVDTDRFVICSDGPMNCALCGYNTTNYSSFKSHIICSHPCWRITKKLSRNRLLVEKSVKVSVPVANFSVPNPIPAVPIQQRVQSKKSKKDSNSSSKESKDKSTTNKDNTDSSSKQSELTSSTNSGSNNKKDEVSDILKDIPVDGQDKNNPEGKRRIYKCTRCLRLFVSEETTVSHVVDSHNVKKPYTCIEVSNDYGKTFSPVYACTQKNCTFSCETIVELEKHKSEEHTQQVVYRCQICGYSAESTKAVKEHAVKIHRQQVMMYGLAD